MNVRVNPLPMIARWLETHKGAFDHRLVSRSFLVAWLKEEFKEDLDEGERELTGSCELIADCMIAAGIGVEAEQNVTVYCVCTGGD